MNTQRDDTKVIIEKWRLDALIDEAEGVLQSAGKTVGSTVVAADNPDGVDEHIFAVKDAARCYNNLLYFIEQIKLDIKSGTEVKP